MRVLHTSDWHLGRALYDKKRYDEFGAFLSWLIEFISNEKIDVLLVAGDVFDTTTPSNKAQEIYYQFLARTSLTCCRNVVVTGGNHDSPTFLNAPKEILGALNIRIVGSKTERPEDEVILLKKPNGESEAIICAVPFLRDRDVRTAEEGEQPDDKTRKLLEGISTHYREILKIAKELQAGNDQIPIIGMGHLFTRNAKTTEGDGVRELYIGTLAHVDGNSIAEGFDYMALGHLHLAQKVNGSEIIRYSGSPLPMGFAESGQKKNLIVIDFNEKPPVIEKYEIPSFRKLEQVSGDFPAVIQRIEEMINENIPAWVEVEVTDTTPPSIISSKLNELTEGSGIEILKTKNKNITDRALFQRYDSETLENISVYDVFTRCLNASEIPAEEQAELIATYQEALSSIVNTDTNAQ